MTHIQILGVEGSEQMKRLRANVEAALAELGMHAHISVVSDVEELMNFHINGIPALVVNGKVVLQKVVPEVEDLKILFRFFESHPTIRFDMKNLLVPVDFSTSAANALHFAIELGKLSNANITVYHVATPSYDPNLLFPEAATVELETLALQRMDAFLSEHLPEEVRKQLKVRIDVGFPLEEIIDLSETGEYDLIVMGSRGQKSTLEKFFGTVSTSVTLRSKCPVLLIPDVARWKPFEQLLFASDFEGTTPETLQYLNSIIDTLGGNVHFVHVERDDTSSTYKEIEQRIFNILFESGEPHYSFTMSKVEGPDVVEALSTYADQHGIDLIILVHPHRSFWESIFHKSVTRAMALNSRIPLMVLPLEKTAAEKQG